MCGRFAITTARFSRIERALGTTFREVRPRYNISPSQTIPVIRESGHGTHEMVEMR
jgi:putative SOS response-associated peptidase YedK